MILKKYIISVIILSLVLIQSSKAASLVIYEEKPYKVKLDLIIDGKKVQKKVKFFDEVIYAVGSKGFVKGGAEWGVGGYCHKFLKREGFYKKTKIFEAISVFKNYEMCLDKIETYTNAEDNNVNEYYLFTEIYLSDKIAWDVEGLFSLKGIEKYADKFVYLSEFTKNKQRDISPISLKQFDENNIAAKKFTNSMYSLFKQLENSEISESQAKKQILSKTASLSMVEYLSALKIIINTDKSDLANLVRNQDYFYSCTNNTSSTAGSFNQKTSGFIGDKPGYESMNFILETFNKNKTSKGFDLAKIKYDQTLSKNNFADLLSKTFDLCVSDDLFNKILFQSRN